ncbi:porin family protein [candidate division KSB1 bacterium]
MRKVVFFGIITLLLVAMVIETGNCQPKFKPGLKFGMTLGRQGMSPDPALDGHSFVVGYCIGLIMERPWGEEWKFSPEFIFVNTGDKLTHTYVGQERTSEFSNTFINIPLLFRYYLGLDKIKPYLTGGPELSYLLSATQEPDVQGETDVSEYYGRSSVGIVLGAGVEYKLTNSPLSLLIEGRFSYGIQDMSNGNPSLSTSPTIKPRVFLICTGIKF